MHDLEGTMAKHLPDPAGTPDPDARHIIDAIHTYLASNRDPLVTARGLRHIHYRAGLAWDASIAQARDRGHVLRAIAEVAGVALETVRNHGRAHQVRAAGRRPGLRAGEAARGGKKYVRKTDREGTR